MAKPNKSSSSDRKTKPIQNLPAKAAKNDNTEKVKGGTAGVKKTMSTQV